MTELTWNEQFRDRTKKLSIAIIKAYGSWKKNEEIYIIGKQLLRSSTSVAANYRAVCRARSDNERYAKICIVVEEADETQFWLEILVESDLIKKETIATIIRETDEIVKVMTTYKYRLEKQKQN
jgi:four helix bundle protein